MVATTSIRCKKICKNRKKSRTSHVTKFPTKNENIKIEKSVKTSLVTLPLVLAYHTSCTHILKVL